jgi:predicted acylesterase/phospholipase RssA
MSAAAPSRHPVARLGRRATVLGLTLSLFACAESRLPAPPGTGADDVSVLGIPNARFWVDRSNDALLQEAFQAEARASGVAAPGADTTANFLALSGGGDNGAFGAGLLCGWTETGQRPQFRLVTGISTGALIAPFAFIGPSRDADLRAVYTDVSPDDIYRQRSLFAALTSDALTDSSPLYALISHHLDERMMAEIAQEYGRGRLLFVGTTNIDLQRPVLWNIGAIATSGKPGALDLIRKILLASAAIPGVFPPVLIDVQRQGETYQEMHVDGGAVAQMFLYPATIRLADEAARRNIHRDRVAYLIRNDRLDPEWADTNRQFLTIAQRAIATMIHVSGANDVFRIYATTQRDNVAYRLAYIGADFPAKQHQPFDRAYMNALFDYAYAKATNGYPWATRPPIFEAADD